MKYEILKLIILGPALCCTPHWKHLQTCPNVHESSCMLDELHWFLLKQRISFRIIGLVWRSFQGLSSGSLRHYH